MIGRMIFIGLVRGAFVGFWCCIIFLFLFIPRVKNRLHEKSISSHEAQQGGIGLAGKEQKAEIVVADIIKKQLDKTE